MIKTGLIGHGYWGKIIEQKLDLLSHKIFVQNSKSYNPDAFQHVDWIFIATPAHSHYEVVKKCIQSKKNVFVEKPFCSTVEQAEELISLARINKVDLCINNIFLYKKNIEILKNGLARNLKFIWHKNGPFNDNLVNDLLYHDIYILIASYGFKRVSSIKAQEVSDDVLIFSFLYGDKFIEIDYSRIKKGVKLKKIIVENTVVDFELEKVDTLLMLIENCLHRKLDFQFIQKLNLQTVMLIQQINQHLNHQF